MTNDLLITAIRAAGLDPDQLADVAGVDPRTAQRWLGGRVPHPRYRQKIAEALHVEELELWPETGRRRSPGDVDEIAGAYARRSDPGVPDWRALLHDAEQHVDLLGYSLHQITEARAITKTLAGKAHAGCQIRIALADPDSAQVAAVELQQRPSGRLGGRIHGSLERLAPLAAEPGIELRQHTVAASHTILRFDDQLLLTVHMYGTPGFQAPLIHLRRKRDYGLFDQLAKHFEDVWQRAVPIGEQGSPGASATPAKSAGADSLLDRLDDVWRPTR
jgi:transcriptional regulator with XRE-family HTH domain